MIACVNDSGEDVVQQALAALNLDPTHFKARVSIRSMALHRPSNGSENVASKRRHLNQGTQLQKEVKLYVSPSLDDLGVTDTERWVDPPDSKQPKYVIMLRPVERYEESAPRHVKTREVNSPVAVIAQTPAVPARLSIRSQLVSAFKGAVDRAKISPGYYIVDLADAPDILKALAVNPPLVKAMILKTSDPADFAEREMVESITPQIHLVFSRK